MRFITTMAYNSYQNTSSLLEQQQQLLRMQHEMVDSHDYAAFPVQSEDQHLQHLSQQQELLKRRMAMEQLKQQRVQHLYNTEAKDPAHRAASTLEQAAPVGSQQALIAALQRQRMQQSAALQTEYYGPNAQLPPMPPMPQHQVQQKLAFQRELQRQQAMRQQSQQQDSLLSAPSSDFHPTITAEQHTSSSGTEVGSGAKRKRAAADNNTTKKAKEATTTKKNVNTTKSNKKDADSTKTNKKIAASTKSNDSKKTAANAAQQKQQQAQDGSNEAQCFASQQNQQQLHEQTKQATALAYQQRQQQANQTQPTDRVSMEQEHLASYSYELDQQLLKYKLAQQQQHQQQDMSNCPQALDQNLLNYKRAQQEHAQLLAMQHARSQQAERYQMLQRMDLAKQQSAAPQLQHAQAQTSTHAWQRNQLQLGQMQDAVPEWQQSQMQSAQIHNMRTQAGVSVPPQTQMQQTHMQQAVQQTSYPVWQQAACKIFYKLDCHEYPGWTVADAERHNDVVGKTLASMGYVL